MADEKSSRRVTPRHDRFVLYTDEQSEALKTLFSAKSKNKPVAWDKAFRQTDKSVQSQDKKNAKSVEEAELERLTQSNKLRGPFMYITLAMVSAIIAVSSFVVGVLAWRGELETPMGVAFTVTLGVEVVAILAIIAHYLFSIPESYLLDKVKRVKDQEEDKEGRVLEEDE